MALRVRFVHALRSFRASADLTVESGETVALVGRTGTGKSTAARLLPRFYDVTGGAIRIDGHDVRDLTAQSLRSPVLRDLPEWILAKGKVGSAGSVESVIKGRKVVREDMPSRVPYMQIDQVGGYSAATACTVNEGGAWPAAWAACGRRKASTATIRIGTTWTR